MYANLAHILLRWTSVRFEDLGKRTRLNGDPANKFVEQDMFSSELRARLDGVLGRLGDDLQPDFLEFTYCMRHHDPRRIIAYVEHAERIVYPIWWDPDHRAMGYDLRQAGKVGGLCPVECEHLDITRSNDGQAK